MITGHKGPEQYCNIALIFQKLGIAPLPPCDGGRFQKVQTAAVDAAVVDSN
jgi:hypothetical protein